MGTWGAFGGGVCGSLSLSPGGRRGSSSQISRALQPRSLFCSMRSNNPAQSVFLRAAWCLCVCRSCVHGLSCARVHGRGGEGGQLIHTCIGGKATRIYTPKTPLSATAGTRWYAQHTHRSAQAVRSCAHRVCAWSAAACVSNCHVTSRPQPQRAHRRDWRVPAEHTTSGNGWGERHTRARYHSIHVLYHTMVMPCAGGLVTPERLEWCGFSKGMSCHGTMLGAGDAGIDLACRHVYLLGMAFTAPPLPPPVFDDRVYTDRELQGERTLL